MFNAIKDKVFPEKRSFSPNLSSTLDWMEFSLNVSLELDSGDRVDIIYRHNIFVKHSIGLKWYFAVEIIFHSVSNDLSNLMVSYIKNWTPFVYIYIKNLSVHVSSSGVFKALVILEFFYSLVITDQLCSFTDCEEYYVYYFLLTLNYIG